MHHTSRMWNCILPFLIGASASLFSVAATAAESKSDKVELITKTTYYEVQGASVAEIQPQVQERGPKSSDGKLVYGYTKYDIRWNWRSEKQAGGFAITHPTVTLEIECIMPRKKASPAAKANNAFDTEWNRFLAALTVHERGHVEVDMKTAEKIRAVLETKWLFKSEEELRAYIEAGTKTCLDEGKKTNADYDQRTSHGATQGATLRDPKK